MKYKTTITELAIHEEKDNAVYGETVTNIKLSDESGGYFVEVSQSHEGATLRFDFDEIPSLIEAIKMLQEGVKDEPKTTNL